MIYLFNTNIQIHPAGLQTYVCIVHDDTVQCKAIRSTIINIRYIELSKYMLCTLVKCLLLKSYTFVAKLSSIVEKKKT